MRVASTGTTMTAMRHSLIAALLAITSPAACGGDGDGDGADELPAGVNLTGVYQSSTIAPPDSCFADERTREFVVRIDNLRGTPLMGARECMPVSDGGAVWVIDCTEVTASTQLPIFVELNKTMDGGTFRFDYADSQSSCSTTFRITAVTVIE